MKKLISIFWQPIGTLILIVSICPIQVNQFSLCQNYPNPFNCSTSIRYELPKDCFVTFKIYDLLGRNILILTNENQMAGQHQFVWDGQSNENSDVNLSSGVYYYRIEAVSKTRAYSDVKKMIYLK